MYGRMYVLVLLPIQWNWKRWVVIRLTDLHPYRQPDTSSSRSRDNAIQIHSQELPSA